MFIRNLIIQHGYVADGFGPTGEGLYAASKRLLRRMMHASARAVRRGQSGSPATDDELLAARVGLAALVVGVGGWLAASRFEDRMAQVKPKAPRPRGQVQEANRAQFLRQPMAARAPVGGPFTLTDHADAPRALADYRGRLVMLYFGCTCCREVCPLDLFYIAETVRALGTEGDQVQPLFITVDPERDTPENLRRYVPYFHSRFVGLTGSIDEVRSIADRYNVHFAKIPVWGSSNYTIAHSAGIFLLDRAGTLVASFESGTKADRLAEVVRLHLR